MKTKNLLFAAIALLSFQVGKAQRCSTCTLNLANLHITPKTPVASPAVASTLPKVNYVVITWTEAEAQALAKVLGTGYHLTGLDKTKTNFTPVLAPGLATPRSPTPCDYQGYYFLTHIDNKAVLCIKFNIHPKDEPDLNAKFVQWVIKETKCKYFIDAGTAGGIWANLDIGDVIVSNSARYGLTLPAKKDSLFTGYADLKGSAVGSTGTWYDYISTNVYSATNCIATDLFDPKGRKKSSGKPKVHFKATGSEHLDVVSNRAIDNEAGQIATYRTMGATLDENDAYVAEACHAIGFKGWLSIKNVSDLPGGDSTQYETFGYCSSVDGAFAVWAFVKGH